ncbi:hypothetical protein PRK78_000475 [Emydomyces testavorans]|uniref:dihydroneopterin aldolase n=1 Tax=Emydomyces testavorans TaxID=2070801 RepID=A0AAF0IFN0_9EURO|nr:hypothetical protein PRK78_000475 [Emydomyces testavorans]
MAAKEHFSVDYINLRNIRFPVPLVIDPDAWNRCNKPQPAIISLRIAFPSVLIDEAGRKDNVATTLNYSFLYYVLEAGIQTEIELSVNRNTAVQRGLRLEDLISLIEEGVKHQQASSIADADQEMGDEMARQVSGMVEMVLHFPKAVLRSAGGLKCLTRSSSESGWDKRQFRIEELRCYCVIGVNAHERLEKQAVDVGLEFSFDQSKSGEYEIFARKYPVITRTVAEAVDASSFKTVEALATMVARIITIDFEFSEVTVKIDKLSALAFVEHSGVEITRTAGFFKGQ